MKRAMKRAAWVLAAVVVVLVGVNELGKGLNDTFAHPCPIAGDCFVR